MVWENDSKSTNAKIGRIFMTGSEYMNGWKPDYIRKRRRNRGSRRFQGVEEESTVNICRYFANCINWQAFGESEKARKIRGRKPIEQFSGGSSKKLDVSIRLATSIPFGRDECQMKNPERSGGHVWLE